MSTEPRDEDRRSPARAASPAAVQARRSSGRRGMSRPFGGIITTGWSVIWITAFATGHPDIAFPLLFLTGPIAAVSGGSGKRRSRRLSRPSAPSVSGPPHDTGRRPNDWANRYAAPAPAAAAPTPPPAPPAPTAERDLAAAVVRAKAAGRRLDSDAMALVWELDGLLRPLLAQVRTREGDPRVRHDIEAIASEHLPAALDAYLALPQTYAHEHRTVTGTTPADELRTQLTLLVEGCRQLGDAVHDADLDRQQQLSRFLEAKFRRSDLDL